MSSSMSVYSFDLLPE